MNTGGIAGVIAIIGGLLSFIVPVLIALGVVYFVWGVVMYVIADSEEAKTKGRNSMIFGIIGLAVIIGLWGLVYIITDTFGISSDAPGNGAPSNTTLQNLLPH